MNAFLTGCFAVQTYVYFTRFSTDRLWVKLVVILLQLLEAAHLFVSSAVMWEMTVIIMENPASALLVSYAEVALVLVTIWMEFTSQVFFLYRLWAISSARLPTVFGIALSLVSQMTGYTAVAKSLVYREMNEFKEEARVVLIITFTTKVACDMWIAACISVYLWGRRKSSSFSGTRRMLDTLILWTVETGLCTSIAGFLALVLFTADGGNNIWLGVFIFSGSVYANTIVAVINGRWIFQRRGQQVIELTTHTEATTDGSSESRLSRKMTSVNIHQEITVEESQ